MFHDFFHKRRWLIRGGFLLLCVAPTLGAVVMIGYLRSSWFTESWRRTLTDRWGVQVSIAHASQPRPGLTRFEGLSINHPADGQTLFRSNVLEVAQHDGEWIAVLQRPWLRQNALPELWRWLAAQMHRSHLGAFSRVRILAQGVRVAEDKNGHTLRDLDVEFVVGKESAHVEASCFADPDRPTERTRLRIARSQGASSDAFECELFSPTPLPCSLASGVVEAAAWLGDDSQFQGTLRVVGPMASASGNVNGQLTGVDLVSLVSQQFGRHLDGQGQVRLDGVQFRDGHVELADGVLLAGPGTIGRELLWSATQALQMRGPSREVEASNVFSYQQLALSFNLREGALDLHGECGPNAAAGVILAGESGPLLFEPTARQRVAGVIHMLSTDGKNLVPADPRTRPLLALLPLDSDDAAIGNAEPRVPR